MANPFVFTLGSGTPVQPAFPGYLALALTANTTLNWPWVDQDTAETVPFWLDVTPTGAFAITLPDARAAAPGQAVIIYNIGASTITILDNAGGAITTITTGVGKYILLRVNTTQAGTWRSLTFGTGTSAADAAALAGYGLSALSGATLNSDYISIPVTGSVTATTAYRAQIFEVTAATGAGTLGFNAAGTLGNGWWMGFSNLGTGAWTLDPNGAETIDGLSTIVLNPTESCLIFSSGLALYTIGRGRSVDFVYTALNKAVGGSSNVTLTSTEASNLLINFTGVLTGNINVIVPSVVNEYMIQNSTTGSFTITVKTAAGTGVVVDQGEQSFVKCDGTNCLNVLTAVPSGNVTMPDGSAALPGLAFTNEQTTGFYRPSNGVLGVAVLGNAIFTYTATGALLTVTGTAQNNVPSLRQVQAGAYRVCTVGGTADVITLTVTPAIAAYSAGQAFQFTATGTNTTAVTANVSGVGAGAVEANGAALVAGDIVSGRTYLLLRTATNFQMFSSHATVMHTADIANLAVTTGKLDDGAATLAKLDRTGTTALLTASAPGVAPTWGTTFEQSTFTPAIAFGGASVGVTYSSRSGAYVRVGNMVTIFVIIVLSSKGSSTGSATITGLPFTGTSTGYGAASPTNMASLTTGGAILTAIGGSQIDLNQLSTTGITALTNTNFNNNSEIRLSGGYLV